MIDATKCEWEESYDNDAIGGYHETIHYFIYPKEDGMREAKFQDEKSYCEMTVPHGHVVSTCLMVAELGDKSSYMMLSPIVETDDGLEDVDWADIYPEENYTEETMQLLLSIAHDMREKSRKL